MPALAKLRNLGPASAKMLEASGIRNEQALREAGPVEAYIACKLKGFNPSLNLVYAIAGALSDTDWRELPKEERKSLRLQIDAAHDILFRNPSI